MMSSDLVSDSVILPSETRKVHYLEYEGRYSANLVEFLMSIY